MALKKYYLVCIILLLLIIIFTFILYKKHTEHFTHGPELTNTMLKYSLNEYAMEKCDSLSIPTLNANADLMRIKYVGGLRMNKFKPINTSNLKANRSYCAIYNDLEQNVQDYLLSFKDTCSLENTKFKGTPFITNVYSDTSQSYALGVPINTCVIEIDDTKVTASNLSAFWNAFGISHCEDLYNEWNNDVNACNTATAAYTSYVAEELKSFRALGSATQHKINELEPVLASNLQALTDIMKSLAQCTVEMEKCQSDIVIAQSDINSRQSDISGPFKNNLHQINQSIESIKNLDVNVGLISTLIGRNKSCANDAAVYKSNIKTLQATQAQDEALYTLLQNLNSNMLAIIKEYNGYITLLQSTNTAYLQNIVKLNADIKTVQQEISVEQALLDSCNSNLQHMRAYDATLQECRNTAIPYPEAIRITLSNLNEEKRLYFKVNASNNDCDQWTKNNHNVLSNLTNMYASCSNNTGVVLAATSQCSSDKITCYDDLHTAKGVITNLNNIIDNNTTNIINLTNDLLKCKTAIANSTKQASTTIVQTQNVLNTNNTCLNTSALQANIQTAMASLSNLQGQNQNQITATVTCSDSNTQALINECHLISPSNCPWPCGGVSPDFKYNLICPGPMGTLSTCAPSTCTANYVGTPSGTIQCLNGRFSKSNLSGCTTPVGCTVPHTLGYNMTCSGNSGSTCDASSCDNTAEYTGTALGGYGMCTNGIWSSPGGPTGCIAPKTCPTPNYPGYGSGYIQDKSASFSSGTCDTGYSGNSSGAHLTCNTVSGTWDGTPPSGCKLNPTCIINGNTFSTADIQSTSTAADGSIISRLSPPGYGLVINNANQKKLDTMTILTNSAVKTCKVAPVNIQNGATNDFTKTFPLAGEYTNYTNSCLVNVGPSDNQTINIATNCPRTDGNKGDNNMDGQYVAYAYYIT